MAPPRLDVHDQQMHHEILGMRLVVELLQQEARVAVPEVSQAFIRPMRDDGSFDMLAGADKIVEADETYIGGKAKNRAHRKPAAKKAALSLVERDGRVRSFHVANVTAESVKPLVAANADKASMLMTDESVIYGKIGADFAAHGTVNHEKRTAHPHPALSRNREFKAGHSTITPKLMVATIFPASLSTSIAHSPECSSP